MIGSGIFITPNELLNKTDSVAISLIVWVACGFLATLGIRIGWACSIGIILLANNC